MLVVTELEQTGLDCDTDHHVYLSDGAPFTGVGVPVSETRKCVAVFLEPKIVSASEGAKESGMWELGYSTRAMHRRAGGARGDLRLVKISEYLHMRLHSADESKEQRHVSPDSAT